MKSMAWIREGDCIRCISHVPDKKGYPWITRGKITHKIARWIMLKRHGVLPPEIVTRHTCDNKWCIRPDHLIAGTQLDNVRDRVDRGRSNTPKGSRHGHSKLNESQILKIRAAAERKFNELLTALASIYPVKRDQIRRIIQGGQWNHVCSH